MRIQSTTGIFTTAFAALLASATAQAQTLGVVTDNTTDSAIIFDADSDTVIGTVPIGPGAAIGDCSVTADQTRAFVTNFADEITVIDLTTTPPSLAAGPNPVPISNNGEDTSLSPNEDFLVVCDGSAIQPVSVIDIATQTEIDTLSLGPNADCNSVEVCSDGTVLATSFNRDFVSKLVIDESGQLTDTGEKLQINNPMNTVCAPDANTAIVTTSSTSRVATSFTVADMQAVTTRNIPGFSAVITSVLDPAQERVFIRNASSTVSVFAFDFITGALGAAPLFTFNADGTSSFFGIDQMALHPDGTKLYLPQSRALEIRDPDTGALLNSIEHPSIVQPIGVCFGADAGPSGQPEIVIDNHDEHQELPVEISFTGDWAKASQATEHFGRTGLFANTGGDVDSYRFTPEFTGRGTYRVMVWNNCFSPRANNVPHTVAFDGGVTTIEVDQDCNTGSHGEWLELGVFPFAAGTNGYVEVSDAGLAPDSFIGVDAVRFLREDVILIDNDDPETSFTGEWNQAIGATESHGLDSLFARGTVASSYRFTPQITRAGNYEVFAWNSCFSPRENNVPHTVAHSDGITTIEVDQDCNTGSHGEFFSLGVFTFDSGSDGFVEISNDGTASFGNVGADAVLFVPVR